MIKLITATQVKWKRKTEIVEFLINNSENSLYHNAWDSFKAVNRGKFIELNTSIADSE
jgi:hypothetical protein